ncbi:tetratricopeptide repeat protein [Runella sp.]|uniref:tetratricopeptide repeat protein n=1 Tax=Runella sp. TaxID=1960881 RepID=UPI0030178EB0
MKISPILLSIALSAPLFAQQSVIKGVVSIHNSEYETGKRQYVQNATVEDDFEKATQQTTDDNGTFKLVFVGVPEKTSAQLIVKKEGLQVVNIDGLSAITGLRDLVRLSMAKPDKIAEYRRQIYKVGKTEAEKNLAAQLKKKGDQIETLQKDAVKNKSAIEKLQQEYAELQAFASKIEEQAQDLARRYAPVNLDDAAPLYRESFKLFQQGELSKALQILRGADLVGQANKILAEEKRINEGRQALNQQDSIKEQRKQDLLQVLGLKADLHKATFEWDSVWFCLELKVQLDSTNVYTIWDLAYFLGAQNKKYEAIHYYKKALILAQTPELKATLQNNLGNLYRDNQKMAQAEGAYNEALKIRRHLVEINPDDFLLDLAIILNNLGIFYRDNQKMPQAEGAYNEALKIRRQMAEKNPAAFLPDLAMILNNLGILYSDNQKMPQAEGAFNEALKIYRQMAEKNPAAFLPDLAMTLNNLGVFYRNHQKMPQAEVAFNEALKIRRQMAEKNPDAFLPDLAMTLNNLGVFYREIQKMPQSDGTNNESLKIYRHLAEKNPDAFLPYVATTLNNLGNYYSDNQEMPQAEGAYNESLKIRRQMAEKNPEAFLQDVAVTLNNLGVFYRENQKMSQAKEAYNESLKIYKQLAEKNPDAFLPYVATNLNNLGVFYKTLKQYDKALDYYGESFIYREDAIEKGGTHFFKDCLKVLRNIAEVKDSAEVKKDYASVVKAGRFLAEGCDSLKGINEKLLPIAVSEYGSLSWWALFAKEYALSEKAARHCLDLDETQAYVLANLGHSQILRGQYKAGMGTYEKLKGKKNGNNKDYKTVILEDLQALEEAGVSHPDVAKAREAIEKW